MALHHVFDYPVNKHEFSDLPKGEILKIALNPYTGYVFLNFEKHQLSTRVSLAVMRRVVAACDVLERNGSFDPLRDYAHLCDTGEIREMLADAARDEIRAFEGGKEKSTQVSASGHVGKKAI